MRGYSAIVGIAIFLASCGETDEASYKGEDGSVANYSTDDEGNVSADIETEDGKKIGMNSGEAPALPDGLKLYPGAKITNNANMMAADGEGGIIAFTSSDTPQEILSYYKEQAEAAGYRIESEIRSGDMQMLIAKARDGNGALSVMITPDADGSEVNLTVARGDI